MRGDAVTRSIRDIGLLLARLGFAFVLFPHGWNKLTDWGVSGTAAGFAQMGVPFPELSAYVAIIGEFGSAILFTLGLLTPLAGLVTVVAMIGAVLTAPGHLFTQGGMKGGLIPLHTAGNVLSSGTGLLDEKWPGASAFVFAVLALALAVAGPGRISLDYRFFGRSEWFGHREA